MLDAASLDNAAVHDAVRLILGLPPLGDTSAVESCANRIEEIRGLLGGSASLTHAQAGEHGFTQALHANAAGWRSPLVAELDLALDVELLSRVEVVDLPGVGVVGDPAGRVAENFVRDDASALVIVARNNGLTHEVVGLLERTGVVTRLLFGGESSKANPIHVIFAITRLDDVAQDRWKQEKSEAKSRGVKPPTREEVFQRLSAEMGAKAKQQIRSVLASSSAFDDLSPEMRARREEVVKDLCDRTEVICVSSKDFMNLQSDDDEDQKLAFLQDADATNVPAFRERLAELAERARGSRRGRITAALESFRSLLGSHVDALAVGTRAPTGLTTDADRFRAALKEIVPPFKARALSQRRELAKYLNERIPPKLDGISLEAANTTRRRLTRLRNEASRLQWSSLNAALVRNGTWNKKGIDYPAKLTSSFVETIAGSWEPSVLDEVRRVVRQLVKDHIELVEEFLGQASQLSGGEELLGQITAQQRVLREQGRSAVGWTSDQLNELSEEVRKKLGVVVGKPLERACLAAVQAGGNRGAGAKTRIIETFETGGQTAIDRAQEQCSVLLADQFRKLRDSLGRLLRENEDPISQCYDAIVREGETIAARAGKEERLRISQSLDRVRMALDDQGPPAAVRSTSQPPRKASVPMLDAVIPMRSAAAAIFKDFPGAEQ